MRKLLLSLGCVAMLASCRDDAPQETVPEPSPAPVASATAPARPSGARTVSEETDLFLFEYSYPAEAGNVPELAAMLDRRLERSRDRLSRDSAEAREAASDNGFPYNKHFHGIEWATIADIPRYLSLSADIATYSGGAHGNQGSDSLVWDKEQAIALEPAAFFVSADALDEALRERLCEELNKERETRRDVPVAEESEDAFDQCVPLAETTVLLGSSAGSKFDRVGVIIDPYVAGPYAEGSFEFTFDVDEKVLAAVEPEYRESFATRN